MTTVRLVSNFDGHLDRFAASVEDEVKRHEQHWLSLAGDCDRLLDRLELPLSHDDWEETITTTTEEQVYVPLQTVSETLHAEAQETKQPSSEPSASSAEVPAAQAPEPAVKSSQAPARVSAEKDANADEGSSTSKQPGQVAKPSSKPAEVAEGSSSTKHPEQVAKPTSKAALRHQRSQPTKQDPAPPKVVATNSAETVAAGDAAGAAREYTCKSGQGEYGARQLRKSYDNSESSCGKLCDHEPGCDGFDFMSNYQNDACRLYGQNQPRKSTGPGHRKYCQSVPGSTLAVPSSSPAAAPNSTAAPAKPKARILKPPPTPAPASAEEVAVEKDAPATGADVDKEEDGAGVEDTAADATASEEGDTAADAEEAVDAQEAEKADPKTVV